MARAIIIHGIKNCDTVKKARAWLDAQGVAYTFHDFKAEGIAEKQVQDWARRVGWAVLLNRAGTTFRGLPESDKADLDEAKAVALMAAQPTLIKRPVLAVGGVIVVGFQEERYRELFKQ